MHWPLAITRNRTALLTIVAAIVAMLGGRDAAAGPIARRLRNAALALLRPAESAARRLIVIAARGVSAAPRPGPVLPFGVAPGVAGARTACIPAFRLFDRAKSYGRLLRPAAPAGEPRIRSFWGPASSPLAPPFAAAALAPPAALMPTLSKSAQPDADAPVDAGRLRLRLAALERALADLPRQARRLARWRARRAPGRASEDAGRGGAVPVRSPLRFGRPPGWRARPDREVDAVLRDCDALARLALSPNTS